MVASTAIKKVEAQKAEVLKRRPTLTPEADIYETEEAIHMALNMPGIDEKSLDLSIDNNVLSIEASQTEDSLEGMQEEFRGYRTGIYRRAFNILPDVEKDKIKAKASNGVLRLTLPKAKKEHAKRIKVELE